MAKPLRLIEQTRSTGNFVCTWCAARFETRAELNHHLLTNDECKRNRQVSNQTQTKYNATGAAKTVHGEEFLRRVRARNCDHTSTQDITNQVGEVIAVQCLYCYTYFEAPQGGHDGNLVEILGSPDGQQ